MSLQIIPASEARSRLLKLVKELENVPEQYVITRGGRPAAMLLSYDEYRSLVATLEVLSDPELVKQLRESRKEKAQGKVHSFEEVFGFRL